MRAVYTDDDSAFDPNDDRPSPKGRPLNEFPSFTTLEGKERGSVLFVASTSKDEIPPETVVRRIIAIAAGSDRAAMALAPDDPLQPGFVDRFECVMHARLVNVNAPKLKF